MSTSSIPLSSSSSSGGSSGVIGPNREVISISINEEGNLFAACTQSGLRVFNMEPLVAKKLNIVRHDTGTLAMCKLLHRTNLMAVVGGGNRMRYADNTVLIWDDEQQDFVLEYVFASRVLALKLRRDRLFVAEQTRITCYTFPGYPVPEKIFTINTGNNPHGICEVTPCTSATELQLLAYPGNRPGSVQLLDLCTAVPPPPPPPPPRISSTGSLPDHCDPRSISGSIDCQNGGYSSSVSISPTSISAHKSDLACIALNRTGTLLATASGKGTLIRIFRTTDAARYNSATGSGGGSGAGSSNGAYIPLSPEKVEEFRRGMDTATVYCIVFSPDNEYVLASSDKGTVHIFALTESRFGLGGPGVGGGGDLGPISSSSSSSLSPDSKSNSGPAGSSGSARSTFTAVPLYNINGSHSVKKFALPAECACVCAFGPDRRSVYAICVDGTFHKYIIGKDGAPCERDSFDRFLEAPEEGDYFFI